STKKVSSATAMGGLGCQSLTRGFGRLRLQEACGLEFVPDGNGHNGHRGARPEALRGGRVELGDIDHDDSAVVPLYEQVLTRHSVHGAADGHPPSLVPRCCTSLFEPRRWQQSLRGACRRWG